MSKEQFGRVCWASALILLGVPLLVRIAVIHNATFAGLQQVVDFIFDDGYYYLAMSANLADSGHSTLDGVTATNGYQPLWFLVLAALGRVVGTRPWTYFVASCALIYIIALAGPLLALVWRRTPMRFAALALATALGLITIQQPEVFLEGLEPILILPLALPLILTLESPVTSRRLMGLSGLLACAFLVRLDALSLYLGTVLVLALAEIRTLRAVMNITLRLSVIVIPTVVAYLAINQWLFGTPVPVSGIAKMIGGPKFSNWGVAAQLFSHWKSLGLLLALLVPLELMARGWGHVDRLFYRSLAVVSFAMLVQCVYYCCFSTWGLWPWYSYLVALDMAIVAARILYLSGLLFQIANLRFAAWVAVLVLFSWGLYRGGLFTWRSIQKPAVTSFNDVSVDMVKEFFPPDRRTVIAMGDRAGGLAYWAGSKLSVVQTEGLTLDVAYVRARAENRADTYLAERYPIEYLVIDREFIPTLTGADGARLYVVPEPIQGRVTTSAMTTFCFPAAAIRYARDYPSEFGTNTRLAFEFAARTPCSAEALAIVQKAATTVGLRHFSLPTEF